jgi:cytidine deaminase
MTAQNALLTLAKLGAQRAYAPYSKFQVGAALRLTSGKDYAGCNVENSSYPLTLCAERNAITSAVAEGARPGDFQELVVYVDSEDITSPCGACRQVMSEFMAQDAKVTSYNGRGESKTWTVAELLPDSFSLL